MYSRGWNAVEYLNNFKFKFKFKITCVALSQKLEVKRGSVERRVVSNELKKDKFMDSRNGQHFLLLKRERKKENDISFFFYFSFSFSFLPSSYSEDIIPISGRYEL